VRSCSDFCRKKAKFVTYSERVFVALVTQNAKGMCRILLSFVACPAVPHVTNFSHKRHDFRKKLIEDKRVLIFSIFASNIIYFKKN
jgi:hypothetical protein